MYESKRNNESGQNFTKEADQGAVLLGTISFDIYTRNIFLFFKIFFLRWTFKKISIEFVTILFLFYVLVF